MTLSLHLMSDTASLATQAGRVLLVVGAQNTFGCASGQSLRNPEAASAKVIGTTILNVRHPKLEYC
jgi:hypothetical protein